MQISFTDEINRYRYRYKRWLGLKRTIAREICNHVFISAKAQFPVKRLCTEKIYSCTANLYFCALRKYIRALPIFTFVH